MSLRCAYHPEREASAKCEKCSKVVCLECKMVYHERHSGGTGNRSYAYSVRREFCPVCFYDRKIKTYGSQAKIGATIFTIITLIMFIVPFILTGDFFGIIFLLIMIPIDILVFVYGPRKVKEFEYQKAEFLNSIRDTQSPKEDKILELFCPGCGEKLDPNTSVCSYCGSVIKDYLKPMETIQEEQIPKLVSIKKKYIVKSIIFTIIGILFIIPELINISSFIIVDYLESLGVTDTIYNAIILSLFVLFVLGFVFIGIGIFIYFYKRKK